MSVAAQPQPVQPDESIGRVLIFRLGSLGDTVVALPSLHLIARAFPNAEKRMLTNIPVSARAPAAAAVIGDSGLVNSFETYPVGTRNPLALFRLLLRLRQFKPEVAVYLKAEGSEAAMNRDRKFLRFTGAQRLIGFAADRSWRARHLEDGTWEPESRRLLRAISVLGALDENDRATWDLKLQVAEIDTASKFLQPLLPGPFLAVSIGTKVQAKDWGERNWSELLRQLAHLYPGYGLLLSGAKEERDRSNTALAGWQSIAHAGPYLNACGLLSPRETAAAFKSARAFVGHDSGPMHLAAAVGTPTVAIFAARNRPQTWFPRGKQHRVLYHPVDCWGCGLETCRQQRKKCILSITVQEVVTALHEALQSKEVGADVA